MPLQEITDRLCSTILSNQMALGVQTIAVAKNSGFDLSVLSGLRLLEFDASLGEAGIPRAINLVQTQPEIFNFLTTIVQTMGTLMGINDTMKGNPDLMLKGDISGIALAIMNTNSIQFNSDVQKAYVRLAEQVGTATIHNIQDFGFSIEKQTREGLSMSATQKFYKRTFGQDNLNKIDKVCVRYGNSLAQTTAGKAQIASEWLKNGLIKTKQEYIEVLETGNLDPMLEAQESQLRLIKEENEALLRGEDVQAIWADDHALHIPEHISTLSSLDARKDPKVINAVQKHTDRHTELLKGLDPILAGLTQQPVIPKTSTPPPTPGPGQNASVGAGQKPIAPPMPAPGAATVVPNGAGPQVQHPPVA
jgi:hypothetical protein